MTVRGVHIRIQDLTHRYTAKSPLTFDKLNLEARPGDALAIIGRSGCGKSTLLHVIAGLLRPLSGTVHLDNELVEKPSPRWVMMFQAPHLFPWMQVTRNVAVGLRFAGWPQKRIDQRVNEVLELVDLQDYANNNVQDLSGGQQQRVALARSLVMEPELLLLDEPFSALDAFTRAALQQDVRAIAKRLGISLIIDTHDIDEAVIMADRALIMAGAPGKIYKEELEIDLPNPRQREDAAVQKMRKRLMAAFHKAAGTASLGAGSGNDSQEKQQPKSEAMDEEPEEDEPAAVRDKANKGSSKPMIMSAA